MKNQKVSNDKNLKDYKLNEEEIKSIDEFANLQPEEINTLSDFIFDLSLILFKTNNDEQS